MIQFNIKTSKPIELGKLAQQLPKATAIALTKTVQQAQEQIGKELPQHFTIRGPWWKKGNKFGVKIKAAEKSDSSPSAEVGTDADWLTLHEGGGIKARRATAQFRKMAAAAKTNASFQRLVTGKNLIAIPTKNVKRSKRDIIQKSQKPLSLKNAFAVQTKKGNVLILNRSRKKGQAMPMYLLRKSAKIDNESGIIEPTFAVVAKRININFADALNKVYKPSGRKP